jgi:subfamily B ATP-binding cassette protein MsbA
VSFYLQILSYGRAYWRYVALAIFFLALYNLFSAVSLGLVIPFLEILFSDVAPPAPTEPFSWGLLFTDASQIKIHGYYALYGMMQNLGRIQALYYFCVFVAAAIILKNLFRYLSAFMLTPVEFGIIRNIRNRLFDTLTRLSLSFYTRKRRGEIVNLVATDMANVQDSVVGTLPSLISDPITMMVLLVAMILISWKLTLFTLTVLPLTGLVISRIAGPLKRKVEKGQGILDSLFSVIDEFIGGIRIVKAFSAENYVRNKYQTLNDNYTRVTIGFRRQVELASPLTEVLSIFVILGVIIYAGTMILGKDSELKASEFMGFLVFFSQFITPIKTFAQALSRVQKSRVSFGRINTLINEPIKDTEAVHGEDVAGFDQSIELRNVSFAYEAGRDVLKNVSLSIRKGETLALVGPSGGGKSTLIDLVCRFYDPATGDILLDGKNLRAINASSLRKLMGIVTQEGVLFNDTVRNNIAYGDAHYTDEEIMRAAKIANAHDFISQLPNGYNTMIGERGLSLSGGQRQRLSIARAVLKNPPILIMDEATSALDSESERLVQDALDKLMQNRTCIVIAHRLSTVLHAHRIAVVREGSLVELGTHAELLAKNGLYAKLYNMQFATEEIA